MLREKGNFFPQHRVLLFTMKVLVLFFSRRSRFFCTSSFPMVFTVAFTHGLSRYSIVDAACIATTNVIAKIPVKERVRKPRPSMPEKATVHMLVHEINDLLLYREKHAWLLQLIARGKWELTIEMFLLFLRKLKAPFVAGRFLATHHKSCVVNCACFS